MGGVAQGIALAGYTAFLADAFGLQTARRRRATGTAGWRKPCSTADLAGETLCSLGCAGTAAAPLLALLGVAGRRDPGAVASVLGLVMVGAGAGVALAGQHQLGEGWKPSADGAGETGLVTQGMLAHVRNPFYAGCALSSLGMTLVAPGVVSACAAGATIAGAEIVVRLVEEPQLRKAHGSAYDRYLGRTGRFLPRRRMPSMLSPG